MAANFSEKLEGPGTHCRKENNSVSIPYIYFPWSDQTYLLPLHLSEICSIKSI